MSESLEVSIYFLVGVLGFWRGRAWGHGSQNGKYDNFVEHHIGATMGPVTAFPTSNQQEVFLRHAVLILWEVPCQGNL